MRALFSCLFTLFVLRALLSVFVALGRPPLTGFLFRAVMGFGIYIFLLPILVRPWPPRDFLSGSTLLGPKPIHRLFLSLGVHVARFEP